MMMRTVLTLSSWLLLLSAPAALASNTQALTWNNLLAPGESAQAPVEPTQHTQVATQPTGEVNPAWDQHDIRLPGYAVPLEGDGQIVTSFLLVPYFGACIHVPPPPTNQVVLVKVPQGVPADDLWDAIKVEGILHVQSTHHDLADAGYQLDAASVKPYMP